MGSQETTHEDGDQGATENVVRLPRDWLGPRDELVPIGPRARAAKPPDAEPAESTAPDRLVLLGRGLRFAALSDGGPRRRRRPGAPAAVGASQAVAPRAFTRRGRAGACAGISHGLDARSAARPAGLVFALVLGCVVAVLAAIGETEGSTPRPPLTTAASLSRIATPRGVNHARLRAHTHTVTHSPTAGVTPPRRRPPA